MEEKALRRLNPYAGIMRLFKEPLFALKYYRFFHRCYKRNNPELFYDKIHYMSAHTDTTKWSELTDKYAVREYVSRLCGDEILSRLYGVYDTPEQIDFDALPDTFVMKTTNGCASNVFVHDKSTCDPDKIRREMAFWMKIRFGDITGQPHYSRIVPRIIAEEMFVEEGVEPGKMLTDYKFNCFNGFVHSCGAHSERKLNSHYFARMLYDMDWQPHPEWLIAGKEIFGDTPRPECLDEMAEIARKLSVGFPYVRVDLYCINGKPKFGEMTFTPGLGFYTTEFQKQLGDLIILPEKS